MILDQKINGTLDRGGACIIIYEEQDQNESFGHTIKVFENLEKVMDSLTEKSLKLNKSN